MRVVVTPFAQSDMVEAAKFWERQREGLGSDFLDFIEVEASQLANTAGMHPAFRKYHRAVVQGRFPYYSIFYRIIDAAVEIVAVVDTRRDPKWVDGLLKRRLR